MRVLRRCPPLLVEAAQLPRLRRCADRRKNPPRRPALSYAGCGSASTESAVSTIRSCSRAWAIE
jgi:hypothetical protein